MNMNLLMQIMRSGDPIKMIMSNMTPQQQMMAQQFLNNPDRAKALEDLKKQYGVSDEQVNAISKFINSK